MTDKDQNNPPTVFLKNKWSWLFLGLAIWYVVLCLRHFFNQRPLWTDEFAVFESLQNFKTTQEYFGRSLWAGQVFPRLYLFLINKFSSIFDYSLLSLRLSSFLAMLVAFGIWMKLASFEIKNRLSYGVFLLSWASSVTMVYYSAELKPYSMDVLISAFYIWFLYNQERWDVPSSFSGKICLLFLMPFATLFSYMTYLFIPLVVYNFFLLMIRTGRYKVGAFVFLLGSCIACGLSYRFDIGITDRATVSGVVKDYFVYTDSLRNFFKTFGEGVNNLFSRWYATEPRMFRSIARVFVGFALIEMFYSFFSHFHKDRFRLMSLRTIPFVIFCEFFILGVLHKYPFTMPRTSLIFCPMVLYMTVQGLSRLKRWNIYLYGIMMSLYIIFISVVTLGIAKSVFSGDLGAMQKIW